MKALNAQGICHFYGKGASRVDVLHNFSLELKDGEFVALMGPSGSGKSTFLHLAAGLITPSSGTIEIAGTKISAMGDTAATKFRRRSLGIVFQDFNLIDTLNTQDNITLPARLDHKKIDHTRLTELISHLRLGGKEKRLPTDLSGGERQRVAIARSLYMHPAAILADEPTGNLDTEAAKNFCSLLRSINTTEHCAILLVTHDPVVAATASRVCFLKNGNVACDFATNHDPATISTRYLETYK